MAPAAQPHQCFQSALACWLEHSSRDIAAAVKTAATAAVPAPAVTAAVPPAAATTATGAAAAAGDATGYVTAVKSAATVVESADSKVHRCSSI